MIYHDRRLEPLIRKQYSPNTATSTLHLHIEGVHAWLYLEQADLNGWPVVTKFAKAAFASGYTLKTLKEVLTQPGININSLPPAPPSSFLDCGSLDVSQQKQALPEFSLEGLQQYIVKFFMVEDLVHLILHYPVPA